MYDSRKSRRCLRILPCNGRVSRHRSRLDSSKSDDAENFRKHPSSLASPSLTCMCVSPNLFSSAFPQCLLPLTSPHQNKSMKMPVGIGRLRRRYLCTSTICRCIFQCWHVCLVWRRFCHAGEQVPWIYIKREGYVGVHGVLGWFFLFFPLYGPLRTCGVT